MKEINRFPAKAGDLGWFDLSRFKNHSFSDIQTLRKNYDYVIIGGGFAGINAAHQLVEIRPDAHIAVFEALKIGMGDSGRNAGFLIDIPHSFGEPGVTIEQHRYRMHLNTIAIISLRHVIIWILIGLSLVNILLLEKKDILRILMVWLRYWISLI